MSKPAKDYTGLRYGRLVFLRKAPDWGDCMWWLRCDCGTEFVTKASAVTTGRTVSCGCYRSQLARKLCDKNFRKLVPIELTYPDGTVKRFESQRQASLITGIPVATLHQHGLDGTPTKGIIVKRLEK